MLSTMAACSVLVSGSIARACGGFRRTEREREKLCSFWS